MTLHLRNSLMLLFLFGLLSFTSLEGQRNSYMMFNSSSIDPDRYRDIKGSPYLFEEFQYGKTVNSKTEVIDSILLNYNGYTNNIEARKGDVFIELDAYHYPLVVIYDDEGNEVFYRRNTSKSLFNRYTRIVFTGVEFMVVEDFRSRVENKKVNDVGVIRENKSFVGKKNYFIVKDNKARLFKMKKKSILRTLGNEGELDAFLKKERIKLNSEENMIKLFEFFDKSGFIYN